MPASGHDDEWQRLLPAPAKINLFLHVTGRRADGYHLLETVFRFVDLTDRIGLSLRADGRITRAGGLAEVAPQDDLVVRAAAALKRETGCRQGVAIKLAKRIPVGAGLGGGSSDAATVLLGLNRLWQLGLDRKQLMAIGVGLGADVPVFVNGHNAYATGIGEELTPVALPDQWFVLAMPPVSVGTASVFGAPDLTRNTEPITLAGFSGRTFEHRPAALFGRNDLESVVFARQPLVREVHRLLDQAVTVVSERRPDGRAAADVKSVRRVPVRRVRMTGSGACIFAVAESESEAREIALTFDSLEAENLETDRNTLDTLNTTNTILPATARSRVFVVAGLQEHPLGSSQVG